MNCRINQMYALQGYSAKVNKGALRETFFVNMFQLLHDITIPQKGDFLIDDTFTFEIGVKTKTFSQIADQVESYLAIDETEVGYGNKIPLWIFGFLY